MASASSSQYRRLNKSTAPQSVMLLKSTPATGIVHIGLGNFHRAHLALYTYTYINRAVTSQVYVTNCGMQDYKPTTIIKFCADAGVGVGAIEWSSWSADGATGEGKYEINDCIPTCVAGKLHSADVTVVLSKSKSIAGKPTLTYIVVKTKDGKNLPLSDSPTDAWPMELAG